MKNAGESLFQSWFKNNPDAVFILDHKGMILETNNQALQQFNITHKRLIQLSFFDLYIWPEMEAGLKIKKVEKEEQFAFDGIHQIRTKDNKAVEVNISSISYEGKKALLCLLRDITKRKGVEEALQESEKRFHTLISQAADAFFLLNLNGYILDVNQRACDSLGYNREELLAMNIADIDVEVENHQHRERYWETITPKKPATFEGMHRRKDGSIFPVEVRLGVLELGKEKLMLGLARDITDRKQVEEALRNSEERLHLAAEAAQMGFWDWNIVTGEVIWSDRCKAHYGIPTETSMTYDLFLQALHPDDREHVDSALKKAVEDRTSYDAVKRTIWPDESLHWTHSRAKVYCNRKGEPVRMVGVTFDITEQKKTQAVLASEKNKLQSLIDSIEYGLTIQDREYNIIFQNEFMKKIFGHIGEKCYRIYEFNENVCEGCPVKMSFEDGMSHTVERKVLMPDGNTIIWENTATPLRDAEGNITTCLEIVRDITKRKGAEKALQESEEKYRTLIQKIRAAVVVHSSDTRILSSNSMAQELLGLTEEQMLGKSAVDPEWHFFREDGNKMPQDEYPVNRVLSTNKELRNYIVGVHRSNQKKDVWALVSADPVLGRDNEIVQVIVTFVDITTQKKAQEELQKTHKELKRTLKFSEALLSAIPTPVFYKDREGRYLGCNRAFSEFMGVTQDQIKGKTVYELWPAEHAKAYHKKDLELMENPARQIYEFRVRDKEGLERPVIYSKDVFWDEKDQVKGIVGAYMDITDRKLAEEALQQAHDEMEQKVEKRTAELKKANEQLTALYKIGKAITAPLNLKKVLNLIALNTAKLLNSDTGVILLIDEKGEFLTIEGSYGLSEKVVKGTHDRLGESIAGRVVLKGEPIIANDLPNDPRFYNPSAASEGLLSCASVPMTIGRKIIGTLDIHSKKDRHAFKEEHIQILNMLASQAAIAIENSRLYEKIQRAKDELEIRVQQRTAELEATNARLKSREMELRNLAESSPGLMGTYYLRPDGSICMPYTSPQIQNLFDLRSEDVIDDATPIMKRTHPDDLDQVKETIAESARTMTPWHHEFRVIHPTRGELWLEGSTNPKSHPDGGVIWYGFIHDITKRKLTEEALRASEERFSAVFRYSPIAIAIFLAEDESFVDMNDVFITTSGYSRDELIGHTTAELGVYLNPSERELVLRILEEKGSVESVEIDFLTKSGEIKTVLSALTNISIKGVKHYVSLILDITERKKSEEKLHLLSKALEAAANSIVITDKTAKIIWANNAFSKLTGYTPDEAIGRNPRELVYSGIHSTEFYEHMWKTILGGNEWDGEIINKRKNGSLYNELMTITPVRDENNEIRNFIAVKQDISDRKKAEAELRDAKEKAEESNRLKDAFLATMNHELRTPLNHIIGFSDLMRSGAILDEIPKYADIIHRSSINLLEIIEDIFQLAMVEQSELRLRLQTFKCLDLFLHNKSVLNEFLDISGKREEIELVFNANRELLLQNITADRTKINQVLVNLFKNAVKFTKSGKIEFGLQKDDPGYLVFYVKDTGIGIPEDKHEAIFEFFRQADDSDTREYGGIGIGLAISQRIAKVIKGNLSVESRPGKGSTFYFRIPVAITDFEINLKEDNGKISKLNLQGKTIIIAEDDPVSVELIKKYLLNTGASIIEVTNGKEVIEILNLNPDVLLMDLNMPVMDGYSATRLVKSKRPEIPVIAITAYALPADRNKAKEAGCDSIISKPVDKSILYNELKKLLQLN